MRAMSEVIAAIVGVLLGLLLAQTGRAVLAWREITDHNAEAAEQNARLLIWVDDTTRDLVAQMSGVQDSNASRGMTNSGLNGGQLAAVKALALHRYRDQRVLVSDVLQRLRTKEGAWHLLWRWVRGCPAPAITVDDEAEPFLNRWREPVTRHGSSPADVAPVFDRTKRTYQDALDELSSLKLT